MGRSSLAGVCWGSMLSVAAIAACAGTAPGPIAGSGSPSPTPVASSSASPAPTTDPKIHIAAGFVSATIASVGSARELVGLPDGDVLVGTSRSQLFIIPNAESAGAAPAPHAFITLPDTPAQGIALAPNGTAIYVATEYGVYKIAYRSGDQTEPDSSAHKIASVRTGSIAPGSDGDVHITSSVAATASTLYVGVGSSCNACVEVDPTRASIQAMKLDGTGMHTLATRIRNPIALAIDPATNVLWAGGAGQDRIPYGHPYEFVDAITLQPGVPVDYGWPDCEENRIAYTNGANCSSVAIPRVEFPAYATHIGATFYPANQHGTYAFPKTYQGALFVTSHGSWHCCPATSPEVDVVLMNGDAPKVAVDWSDPTKQWTPFAWDFQVAGTWYRGRPTGIAVGSQGSLFVADDQNGVIYRIRPAQAARIR